MKEVSWSPLAVWGTADPDPLSQVARAFIVGPFCYGCYEASGTDGNGATTIALPLPTRPADINANLACEGYITVDGTTTDGQFFVDMLDNTAANRYVESNSFTALTNAKAWSIAISFWYELESGDISTFSPTITYTTSTWDTVTTVARYGNLEQVIHFLEYSSTADAKGVTAGYTTTMPTGILDLNTYVPFSSVSTSVAGDDSVDYVNCLFLADMNNATEGSRTATTNAVGVMANGKAATMSLSGIYEQIGWSAFTPTMTFTGTAPTAAANVGRYKVVEGMLYGNCYYTTTDGNGCTALTISNLPVDPAYLGCEIPCCSMETVNTTDSDPCAYIPADEQASSDRAKILFKNFSTMTDAVTGAMYVSFFYPVG